MDKKKKSGKKKNGHKMVPKGSRNWQYQLPLNMAVSHGVEKKKIEAIRSSVPNP